MRRFLQRGPPKHTTIRKGKLNSKRLTRNKTSKRTATKTNKQKQAQKQAQKQKQKSKTNIKNKNNNKKKNIEFVCFVSFVGVIVAAVVVVLCMFGFACVLY